MSSRRCMVLHCSEHRSNPEHQVDTPDEGAGWHAVPVCGEHWERIDAGEPWLWVPGRRLKGIGSTLAEGCILMGETLAGYGLVVDADIRMTSGELFSPQLADAHQTPTLSIDGQVFGAGEHVSIEVILTPDTAQRLKEALRFFR